MKGIKTVTKMGLQQPFDPTWNYKLTDFDFILPWNMSGDVIKLDAL